MKMSLRVTSTLTLWASSSLTLAQGVMPPPSPTIPRVAPSIAESDCFTSRLQTCGLPTAAEGAATLEQVDRYAEVWFHIGDGVWVRIQA